MRPQQQDFPSSPSVLTVYHYDAAGQDREVELTPELIESADEKSLLWIDIVARSENEIHRAGKILGLGAESLRELLDAEIPPGPHLDNYGNYFQFNLIASPGAAARDGDDVSPVDSEEENKPRKWERSRLDFVIGKRWLLTVHDEDLKFLRSFREQDKAETEIGGLSPQALAASLLDWHLETFFEEVARIELHVDRLDERILGEPPSGSLLGRMAAVRRRISRLRRILVVQRPVFYGLGRPDLTKVAEGEAASHYEMLASRFERAVDEVERTRDLVVGSFELFTSRTSQETNDLVRSLTFFTVIIGGVAAIAGLFGMNFDPPFFRTGSAGFFAVTGGLLFVATVAWAWAKHKHWV